MKLFTLQDIRSWNPCVDPLKYLPEGWEGTMLELMEMNHIPVPHRLWVLTKSKVLQTSEGSKYIGLF